MIRLLIFFAFALFALLGTLIYAENKATNNGLPLVSGAAASDIPRRNMLYAPCPLTKRNLPQFTDDEESHA